MALVGIGTSIAIFFNVDADMTRILVSLLFIVLRLGIALPAFNAAMMKTVDGKILSTASGVFIMFACLGNSLGIVTGTSMLVGVGQPKLLDSLANAMPDLTLPQLENIKTVFGSAYRDLTLLEGLNIDQILSFMNQAFVQANVWIMIFATAVGIFALVFTLKTIKIPKKVSKNDNAG